MRTKVNLRAPTDVVVLYILCLKDIHGPFPVIIFPIPESARKSLHFVVSDLFPAQPSITFWKLTNSKYVSSSDKQVEVWGVLNCFLARPLAWGQIGG